jgi:hypothetical protein
MDEAFSKQQVIAAIEQWLEYGESSFNGKGHKGYFSGSGWAARCLRHHLEQIKSERKSRIVYDSPNIQVREFDMPLEIKERIARNLDKQSKPTLQR